jgi:hypothetical protein
MMSPHLEVFSHAIDKLYRAEDAGTFWSCRPAFTDLLASPFLAEVVRDQLRCCLTGQGELLKAGSGMSARVELPSGVHLDFLLLDPAALDVQLFSYPWHSMMGMVGGVPRGDDGPRRGDTELIVERYRHVPPYRNDLFDPHAALAPLPDVSLTPGRVLDVEAGWDAFRIRAVSRAVPLVLLHSKAVLEFAWQYDAVTLEPRQAICPRSSAYRLFYATKLLGEVPAAGSAEALLRISGHPSHFVRWAALQALFSVDPAAAQRRLLEATDDPHPRVRQAAQLAAAQLAASRRAS